MVMVDLPVFVVGFLSGFSNVNVLVLDHINGSGLSRMERWITRSRKSDFYLDLERDGFPAGFQTLCANCNLTTGKGRWSL